MNSMFNQFSTNYSILVTLIILLVTYLWFYLKNRHYNRLLSLIPGPKANYPLIGNLDLLLTEKDDNFLNAIHKSIVKLAEQYRNHGIFRLKLGPIQRLFIFRRDLVEDLLKDKINIGKSSEYALIRDWWGNGLAINSDCESWNERRKQLTPAFHNRVIENFIPVINEKVDILIEKLSNISSDQCFDLWPFINQCTLDIVSETILDYKMDSQQNQNLDYLESVHSLSTIISERFFRPWLWPNLFFYKSKFGKLFRSNLDIVHGLARKAIDKRIKYFEENKIILDNKNKTYEKFVFLDLLLDKYLNEKTLTYQNLFDEVNVFMFTGHDTAAVTLSFVLYLIGLYPDVQQRLYTELQTIVSNNKEISKDHINQMVYLDAVLNESMRIYPTAQFILRHISSETKLGNYTIPKGVTVTLHLGALFMDPNVFPEPNVFNPDRFLGDNSVKSGNTFSFVPFSAGPRNCIGQRLALIELKIILSKILISYSFESMESRNEIKVLFTAVTNPVGGIKVKISPRY